MDVPSPPFACLALLCCCCCCWFVFVPVFFGAVAAGPHVCFPPQPLNGTASGQGNEGAHVSVSCAGEIVVAVSAGGSAVVYHLNETAYSLGQQFDGVTDASLTCDGSFLATILANGSVAVYAATGPNVTAWFAQLPGPLLRVPKAAPATRAVFSCRGRVLVVATTTGAVHVFGYNGTHMAPTVAATRVGRHAAGNATAIASLAVSCSGALAAVGMPGQRAVYVLNTATGNVTGMATLDGDDGEDDMVFGASVALAGGWSSLLAVGAPGRRAVYTFTGQLRDGGYVPHDLIEGSGRGFGAAVALSGNGARLLVGSWSGYAAAGNVTMYVWNEPQHRYLVNEDGTPGLTGDPELGRALAMGHAGREFAVAAGGTATRRIAVTACYTREGTNCPACAP